MGRGAQRAAARARPVARSSGLMTSAIEQTKWALYLRMQTHPTGSLPSEDDRRVQWSEVDVYLAIRGFAGDVTFGSRNIRRRAVEALGWLGDERGVGPLLRGLDDCDAGMRCEAAAGLAQFDRLPEWSVEALARVLRDENVGVRDSAATGLGRCGCQAAVTAVAPALEDGVSGVRASAADALLKLGLHGYRSDDVIATLSELLDDADQRVACAAFWALRAQAGSASDERCSDWRWSIAGARAWGRATYD